MRPPELLLRADRGLFGPEAPRRLAAVRIGLCGVLAVRLATTDYGAVAAQPRALFQPAFYMHLLGRMPSEDVARALQVCGVAAAVAAAAGLVIRVSLPVALGCSLVLNGMLNSAGRIIVGDAVLTLCLIVLVASGRAAAEALSPTGRSRAAGVRYGWPIRTMMVIVALTYFFAGIQKWRYSGPAWFTSDNLRWILYGQTHPNGLSLFVADRPVLAHIVAAGALVLETCFPLVLVVPRLRRLFIPAAVVMHVGIRLTLGLDYSAQWLALLVVFVNWPVVTARLGRAATRVPVST